MKIMIGIFIILVALAVLIYREQIGKDERILSKANFWKKTKLGIGVIGLFLIASILCFEDAEPAGFVALVMGFSIIGDSMREW